jgi:TatD DNase family protein
MKLKAKSYLIDTHAHVNFSAFKDDADEIIKKALDNNVFLVNVGSQYSTSKRAVEYAEKYATGVWAAIGIHPVHLQKMSMQYKDDDELEEVEIKTAGENFDYAKYLELAKNPKVVAIGEVGLDYHHFADTDNQEELKNKQKAVLVEFIKLSNEVQKPVMLHCWGVKSRKEFDHAPRGVKVGQERDHARTDAYEDLYEILKNNPVKKLGVIHSFVGSYKTAQKFIEMGYKIGLNGIITYGISYDRLIKEIDIKDIVLETDCPYLTPVPKKGERNEPLNVELVAQKIAQIKQISAEEVAKITTKTAQKLLNIE